MSFVFVFFFFFKQKTAYEMRISDWSSDVCSSDLAKPVLYVCNVDEGGAAEGNEHSARVFDKAAKEGARAVIVSAAIEAEIVTMPAEDRAEFLADLGDRTSVVYGKRVSVRVDIGGRRIIKKNKRNYNIYYVNLY